MTDRVVSDNSKELSAILINEKKRYNLLASYTSNRVVEYDILSDILHIYEARDVERKNVKTIECFLKNIDDLYCIKNEDKIVLKQQLIECRGGIISINISYDGREFNTVTINTTVLHDSQNNPYEIFGVICGNETNCYCIETDHITKLPYLESFKEKCREIICKGLKCAVVYTDINNFKFINDTVGFLNGDRILCDYANILNDKEYGHLCVTRISADNFAYIVEYKDFDTLKKHIFDISERFHEIVKNSEFGLRVATASGACVTDDSYTAENVIDNANIARKKAKLGRKDGFILYDFQLEKNIKCEINIIDEFDDAIENREFLVYYQPKISFFDEKIIGMEALVRWKKSDGTIITPDIFIPVMEATGLIVRLDFYVYENVCRTIRKWLDSGIDVKPISLNVSRAHVKDHNFVNQIKALVDKYGISPELIELELTESIFLQDVNHIVWLMEQLKENGFSISIDDFGSGYSSLTILKDLPADVLKIDKEFFRKGEMKSKDKIIVSSVVSLAKKLEMKVLCEGVETKNQVDFLKSIDCDSAQGFFYSRPIPLEELEKKYFGENTDV